MCAAEFLPAALIGVTVTLALAAAQLMPQGQATVLVRMPSGRAAATPLAASHAALLSSPAPGYAVLHGDAARIRAAFGAAVLWRGALCGAAP